MTWIDRLVHLIVNSALASLHRGKTMNYANNRDVSASGIDAMRKSVGPAQGVTISLTDAAINEIQASLCDLHVLITEHESQISPCLRNGLVAEEGEMTWIHSVPESPLLVKLDAIRSEVARARTRLIDINQRVTL